MGVEESKTEDSREAIFEVSASGLNFCFARFLVFALLTLLRVKYFLP
jgi:hypothetical protein